MQTLFDIAVVLLALFELLVTFAVYLPTHQWWVRMWDFPRLQIAAAALLTFVVAFFASMPWSAIAMTLAGIVVLRQGYLILPYTPLMPKEMKLVPRDEGGSQIVIVSSNVEMPNERYDRVAKLIDETDPDVLLLMETDAKWERAMEPHIARYPTILREIRDNYYGMIFATRLDVEKADIVYLSHDDTPTLFAELKTPAGQVFRMIGLHPRPPVPGEDTDDRDAELLFAARFARKRDVPLIAIGDFNDAAWSSSSRTFKKVGEYLDPRRGRGLVASFDANRRWLRVPIDQLYVTEQVAIADFRRGDHVGSDHFPLIARVDLNLETAKRANKRPKSISIQKRYEMDRIRDRFKDHLPPYMRE